MGIFLTLYALGLYNCFMNKLFWKNIFGVKGEAVRQKEVDMAVFTRSKTEELPTEATKLSAATLGADVEFKGSLVFKERLCINGRFEGDLSSDGGLLVLGRDAEVKADIRVGNMVSEGKIYGNITANDKVELRAPAQVFGDIEAARLNVEEGVIFVGNANVNPGEVEPNIGEPASAKPKKKRIPEEDDILENQIKF